MTRKKPFRLRPSGKKGYHLDAVPEIDQFIPEAVRHANKCFAASEVKGKKGCWDTFYHDEMNRITAKAGLRVL